MLADQTSAVQPLRPRIFAAAIVAIIGMVYLTIFTLIALRGSRPAGDCFDRIASVRAGFLDSAAKTDHTWVRRQDGHWVVGVLFRVAGNDAKDVTVACHHTSARAVYDTTYRIEFQAGNQLDGLKRNSASIANPLVWLDILGDGSATTTTGAPQVVGTGPLTPSLREHSAWIS